MEWVINIEVAQHIWDLERVQVSKLIKYTEVYYEYTAKL